ncbi:MAG TPA: hypothetical protein VEG30_04955 [Terriglobales bacterium]|nr:hypothetical protein [Terriglobales bacterium]
MRTTSISSRTIWRQLLANAVVEADPSRLQKKLAAAQRAIDDRELALRRTEGHKDADLKELAYARATIEHLRELARVQP